MTENDRRNLTFRQAEGLDPLPAPLALGQISADARALIWLAVHTNLSIEAKREQPRGAHFLGSGWMAVMKWWWVRHDQRPIDEFDGFMDANVAILKSICYTWDISRLFDFLTAAIRMPSGPKDLSDNLAWAFNESRMAYRIEDKTIWPAATIEEGETINRALADLSASEYGGARSHLKQAGSLLTAGDWAGSIRESIHAVEGVAILIEPGAKTLSAALKKLRNADRMNVNLKEGLERLYAYTSDEKGIRHAKAFEETSVDQADAVYMLGACAAFVSFLIARRVA